MEWLNEIPKLNLGVKLIVALTFCYVLYFVFGRKEELSKHAAENTVASVWVAMLNLVALILFVEDINRFAQKAYAALGIPTLDPNVWNTVPPVLACLLAVVAKDFADYWSHRAMHTKWGWATHAAHHSDTHVNAFTGFRIHFLEAMLMTLYYVILLTWLQLPALIPIMALFYTLHGMYVHMDLPFNHGPLKYLISSPVYHRWHHADEPAAYGKNLANIMPIYDVIFGTYYNPGPCNAPMGALKSGIEDKNPFKIMVYPFQNWVGLIRDEWTKRRTGAMEQPAPPKQVTVEVPDR